MQCRGLHRRNATSILFLFIAKCVPLRSTGTEDEFLSSYYFDLGPFFGLSAGLFYAESGDGVDPLGAQSAMYRTYQVPYTSAFLL